EHPGRGARHLLSPTDRAPRRPARQAPGRSSRGSDRALERGARFGRIAATRRARFNSLPAVTARAPADTAEFRDDRGPAALAAIVHQAARDEVVGQSTRRWSDGEEDDQEAREDKRSPRQVPDGEAGQAGGRRKGGSRQD